MQPGRSQPQRTGMAAVPGVGWSSARDLQRRLTFVRAQADAYGFCPLRDGVDSSS